MKTRPDDSHGRISARRSVALILTLVVIYTGLTLLFTSPLGNHFATSTMSGSHSGDQCQTVWFFWWTKVSLIDTGSNPFWTDMIYYPYGTGVGYQIALATDILAVGLSTLLGVPIHSPLVFNLLILLAFVLTGIGSFLLLREINKNTVAAFVGSLFVAFSPYRLWNLEHLNLLSMGWALMALYFAIRYFRQTRVPDMAGAIGSITLSFYTDFFTTAVALLVLMTWFLIELPAIYRRTDQSRVLMGVGAGVLISLVLWLPGLKPLFDWAPDWNIGWDASETFGAGLIEFFRPHWSQRSAGPGEAYLGWILLGLFLLALYACWKDRETRRWSAIALVFAILALGPSLKIEDTLHWRGLLPYRWLQEIIPFLGFGRTPGRFVMAVNLALSVVAARGIAEWIRQVRAGGGGKIVRMAPLALAGVSALGIYLEIGDTPVDLVVMDVPPVYQDVARDSTITAICDLPIIDKIQIGNWYMYWQTVHGKKSVNGFLTRHSPESRTLVDRIHGLDTLGADGIQLLRDARVNAVVLHQPGMESRLIRIGERGNVIESDTSHAP